MAQGNRYLFSVKSEEFVEWLDGASWEIVTGHSGPKIMASLTPLHALLKGFIFPPLQKE